MSFDGSDVQVVYDDDVDITNHAVISRASFSSNANANPGEVLLELRDPDREMSFVTGRRLRCYIDGIAMWSGFVFNNGRSSFFPAGDGRENTRARRFILRGLDNNVLLDRRVLRRPANYLKALPNITTDRYDGDLLREALANYFDMPSWLDIETFIDDVTYPAGGDISAAEPWAWPQQGSKLRSLFEDLARWSAAVFYIGPDDAVHYHAVQDRENPWGFSDNPNRIPIVGGGGFEGAYYGFRELNAEEDGSQLATDAFVWGGSPFAGAGGTVFKRATDDDLEDVHGKWQLAETHFNDTNYKLQKGVDQRANMIVFGNPDGTPGGAEPGSVVGEGPRGLRFSQWAYQFTWSTKDVPEVAGTPRHLYPGDIVPIQLWSYSEDEGVTPFSKFLPLRSMTIGFPSGAKNGKAHVFFSGAFDLRNEDPKQLWSFLRRRGPAVTNITVVPVTDDSDAAPMGGFGQFTPTPTPDGVETVFTVKFPYIPRTVQLYADTGSGLTLRQLGTFFTESSPDEGEITLVDPTGVDELYVVCRTQPG